LTEHVQKGPVSKALRNQRQANRIPNRNVSDKEGCGRGLKRVNRVSRV